MHYTLMFKTLILEALEMSELTVPQLFDMPVI